VWDTLLAFESTEDTVECCISKSTWKLQALVMQIIIHFDDKPQIICMGQLLGIPRVLDDLTGEGDLTEAAWILISWIPRTCIVHSKLHTETISLGDEMHYEWRHGQMIKGPRHTASACGKRSALANAPHGS
jgi:hypothetical protein